MSNLVSIILIIASIGLFFGYTDPAYMKVKEIGKEKADYESALSKSKELQQERDKLLDKFNKISKPDVERLSKLLPDHIDNVRLVIDIDDIAKNYGMRIRNFESKASGAKSDSIGKDNSTYGTLTFSFSTTASYNTFLAFLRDLERSLRIMDVTSISFESVDTGPLYDYDVTLKTYWLK